MRFRVIKFIVMCHPDVKFSFQLKFLVVCNLFSEELIKWPYAHILNLWVFTYEFSYVTMHLAVIPHRELLFAHLVHIVFLLVLNFIILDKFLHQEVPDLRHVVHDLPSEVLKILNAVDEERHRVIKLGVLVNCWLERRRPKVLQLTSFVFALNLRINVRVNALRFMLVNIRTITSAQFLEDRALSFVDFSLARW